MNQLSIAGTPAITSREIAELVEKRHDNVKRTIEALVQQRVIASPQIEEKPTAGRPVAEYVFAGEQGKRDSIVVVAQLSPEFTARLVDRWQELERHVAAPPADPLRALSDPATLRGLLLTYSTRVQQLEDQAHVAAPKLRALEQLSGASGEFNITEAAKLLKVQPRQLFTWMEQHGWIYRRAGGRNWLAYQQRIQQGVLTHQVYTQGERMHERVLVTAKGLARLGELLSRDALGWGSMDHLRAQQLAGVH